jgi:hypothetical protein
MNCAELREVALLEKELLDLTEIRDNPVVDNRDHFRRPPVWVRVRCPAGVAHWDVVAEIGRSCRRQHCRISTVNFRFR